MFKTKKNIIFLIVFMIPVFLLCIYTVFAIFRNETAGNANLQLAKWEVEVESPDSELNLVSGVTNQTYTLKVKNLSDVDIDYKIVISGLPDGVKVRLDDSLTFQAPTDGVITFDDAEKMSILYSDSTKEKTHTLEFKSEVETREIRNKEINIDVVAKQKL